MEVAAGKRYLPRQRAEVAAVKSTLIILLLIGSCGQRTVPAQLLHRAKLEGASTRTGKTKPTSGTPRLAIVVLNFAKVKGSVLVSARSVATKIFKEAGIETEWFDCQLGQKCDVQTDAAQFRLIIQSRVENVVKDDLQARELTGQHALGFAIPCKTTDSACLSYVFFSPISSLARQYGARENWVLAHVMAHEIGHTLLGPDAHTEAGIMQPSFLIRGTPQFLYFDAGESKQLREKLYIRNEAMRARLAGFTPERLLHIHNDALP